MKQSAHVYRSLSSKNFTTRVPIKKLSLVVSVVGKSTGLTVNNGAGSSIGEVEERPCTTRRSAAPASAPRLGQLLGANPRQVIVTPLSSVISPMSAKPTPKPKAVRDRQGSVCKGKKVTKMFTLRSIDSERVCSRDELKHTIRSQLHGDVCSSDFDVGYISGSSIISIRNQADLSELWTDIQKGVMV